MRQLLFICGLALAIGARAGGAPIAADDWPQWRGPQAAGIGDGTYPDRWSATEHVAWKAEIPGTGHSSPVVWGNRVYVTSAVEGAEIPGWKAPVHLGFDRKPGYVNEGSLGVGRMLKLNVTALDVATGKVVWSRTAFDGPPYDDRHSSNTYASPTIATDGTWLYAFFESAGMYAYDMNGTLKWKLDLGGMAKAGLGPGTSPLIYQNLLILQCDQEMGEGSFIGGFDRTTGKEIWRVSRTTRRSWATPLIVSSGGRDELLASGAEMVVAYDPKTGKELWTAPGTVSHPIPSFVQGKGLVFATAGSQQKVVLALRPGEQDAAARLAWRYNKGTAYVASPIYYKDYLYLLSDGGSMTCLDPLTGAVIYEARAGTGSFRSSPVAFGDKILITSEEGNTYVVKAGPTHEVLATNSIGETVWSSIALAHGMVFVRGDKHLFAIK
jgi:outer membrane protein assembly factor BamB